MNVVVALGTRQRLLAERDMEAARSRTTATGIWLTYLIHLALTLVAALNGWWPIPAPFGLAATGGSALILFGAFLFLAGSLSFGSIERMSGRLNNRLVTDGIYRWSRNPQNSGWCCFLLGVAVAGRSGWSLLMAVAFWLSFVAYVRTEERQLERQFGAAYRRYLERSHRYFGPYRNDADSERA